MVVPQEQHHCHQDSRGTTSTRYRGAAGGGNHPSYCCRRCCRSTCPSYQLRTRRPRIKITETAYACGKCIPCTQKAYVPGTQRVFATACVCCTCAHSTHSNRLGARAPACDSTRLTLSIGIWSLFLRFVCPRQQLRPLVAKISCAWNSFRSAVFSLISPGACCKKCTAPLIVLINS